jgi:3-methyladenine DNA glycosylase AlkC
MVSISSSKKIRERTAEVCESIKNWEITNDNLLYEKISNHLKKEYDTIPKKERIGKGTVYISRYAAKETFNHLQRSVDLNIKYISSFVDYFFTLGKENESLISQHFSLLILAEYVYNAPENFSEVIRLIEMYANDEEWSIRETIGHSVIAGLKTKPIETLQYLELLAENENQNLRRLTSECLRPIAEVKWLRDPNKNQRVLKILSKLNKDPSIYVRKSVGNNVKDLSKYMPGKILDLMQKWINESDIKVHDELATEIGLNPDQKRLLWTIKHGMRWIKNKNPEFHNRIEKILGKRYLLYFDEKSNRLARKLGN